MKYRNGILSFFIGFLTIEIYHPIFNFSLIQISIKFDTILVINLRHQDNRWWIDRSIAIKLLGFGIGFAWKHCDNPNIKELNKCNW
jgi:hypothetical protein